MLKRLGERLFNFYCHPDFQEDIKGDLEEYYALNLEEKGEKYANRKYLIDILLLFRISLLRDNWFSRNSIHYAMVKNNLKVAYRSMMRHKFYTFLNLGGLAVSIAACILISVYVTDELSYDKYHKDAHRIFRIASYLKFGDNEFRIPAAPAPMAEAAKTDFPEIVESGRMRGDITALISYDNNYFQQEHISYADQTIFNILSFDVVRGDPNHLLDQPNTVVLDESTALKFFGSEDPIGKVIRYNETTDAQVTGVIRDIPDNSHLNTSMMITMLNDPNHNSPNWLSNNYMTYYKLGGSEMVEDVHEKYPAFLKTHVASQVKQFVGVEYDELLAAGSVLNYQLQPVPRIHLYSRQDYGIPTGGSIQYVYIFSVIGLFILMIACINFMNLATARASIRAKEVGVRKVLGSLRKQLVNQFLTEAVLNSLIAFLIAIGLVYLVLPSFNQLTDKNIANPIFLKGGLWPYLLGACLVVGWISGIYPAFVLSRFRPAQVLKGDVTKGRSASTMRNVLVVIQFTASIALIIGSIVVYRQLDYLQNKELGFNKDQIIVINDTQFLGQNIEAFRNELLRSPAIDNASISGYIPAVNASNDFPLIRVDATSSDEAVSVQNWTVDEEYQETFGIELVAGRFFSKDFPTDSAAIILNETAIRRFGYADDPIGKKIKRLSSSGGEFTIIGVMKDFHFRNMTELILPHGLYLGNSVGAVNIKFAGSNASEALGVAEQAWDRMSGGRPFDYTFLSELFEFQLTAENRVKTIFTIFAILAIVIACLGLFGLAAYVTEQRKKEVGIRKVLGASVPNLLSLFFSSFNKLILISALLATPISFYFMRDWLSDFTYQVGLSPTVFIIGALGTFLIAWLTVGYQSLKAAKRNPIDNLRYE